MIASFSIPQAVSKIMAEKIAFHRYKDAQRALSQLERSGCQILGAVMNKIDTKADKYYSFYYKHYGEYYRRAEEENK